MPIHDWKRADVGLFHHFHQRWAGELCDGLNAGVLPPGYFALVEQRAMGLEPDVLALKLGARRGRDESPDSRGGLAVADAPPKVHYVAHETDADTYARKANVIGVRNRLGELVAMVEIVSPGDKHSKAALQQFVEKTVSFLLSGVNVLVIDLFPPTPRDPAGVHKAIWDEFQDEPFDLPPGKPLTLVSYAAVPGRTAYVEPVAVGDALPPMPLFVDIGTYVPAPLEETYQRTWDKCPVEMRDMVLNPEP